MSLFAVLSGPTWLWSERGVLILPAAGYSLIGTFLLICAVLFFGGGRSWRLVSDPRGWSAGLLLWLVSDYCARGYNLLPGPAIRGEIILFSAAAWLSAVYRGPRSNIFAIGAMVIALALLWFNFFAAADGRVLISDDHASFQYRLQALRENFPAIPFYNPLWNAGLDSRDFFATGALSVFFIFAPLIYAFPIAAVYNLIIASILFGLLPLSTIAAARLLRLSWFTACIAALLAVSSNLLWYRWGLKYGTLGFLVSATLLPLVAALICRHLDRDRPAQPWEGLALTIIFSLMLLWSASGLVWLPVIAYCAGLLIARVLGRAEWKLRQPLLVLAALVLINVPWIVIFTTVSKVHTFIKADVPSYSAAHEGESSAAPQRPQHTAEVKHKRQLPTAAVIKKSLREGVISWNPVLAYLIIPGIALLPRGRTRIVYGITFAWLLFSGVLIAPLMPQLELDRMLVLLPLIGALPAALAVERLFTAASESAVARCAAMLSAGMVLAGIFAVSSILWNRSLEQFHFSGSRYNGLQQGIRVAPPEGRILFSGFVLHEMDGGHIAPLSYLTGRAFVAISPFHNVWRYRGSIPSQFVKGGIAEIESYLDLMNISAVFAHEADWKQRFSGHPDLYRVLWSSGRFTLFGRTNFKNSWFLSGEGALIAQDSRSITVRVDQGAAVLRFIYYPFLDTGPCRAEPFQAADDVSFIALKDCPPGAQVRIAALPVWQRIAKEWQR